MHRRLALAALVALVPSIAAANGPEKKKGGGASYIQIQTLTASIFRRNGTRGVLTMEVGVDVANDQLRELAAASAPRLRAAYAQVLQIYASGLPAATLPDADYLAAKFQRETDRVLGKPGAKLLIGTILIN
ncbi:hypothetical protein [Caulobacter sp. NIBR1757]|uniref:hypothetical protein n=1 Tax=Caulobacter sp. NIBR1757 TaxID=3016000 RepID=UPI0022F101B2|nr:hypothetical protein [Caulobacter sp. NIBR1757]WGM41142.1 hypothetical protein AMEJIAPC_04091 [Caulobacter sp. NIBR1757]